MSESAKIHTFLVDSTMRDSATYPSASSYRIPLPETLKEVRRVRLLSAEIPASFYVFRAATGTTTLHLGVYDASGTVASAAQTVTIPDGNYSTDSMCAALAAGLNGLTFDEALTFAVAVDPVTYRLSISTTPKRLVYVSTQYTQNGEHPAFRWGLEYFLGFPAGTITTGAPCVAPSVVQLQPYNYLVLDVPEINGLAECDRSTRSAFAKIQITVDSFGTIVISEDCCTFNTSYPNPHIAKLTSLTFNWRFLDGTPVDFNGAEHSFTLEIESCDNCYYPR